MNKADYQMVSWICLALGIVLFVGVIYTDILLSKVSSEMNAVEFFWSNAYSWLLFIGAVILMVIAGGFHWRARQEK